MSEYMGRRRVKLTQASTAAFGVVVFSPVTLDYPTMRAEPQMPAVINGMLVVGPTKNQPSYRWAGHTRYTDSITISFATV
jgi:hypothetical protein